MNTRALVAGLALLISGGGSLPAAAGSLAPDPGAMHYPPEQIAAFAKQVEREAAARGAHVFLLSRVGRPRSELPPGVSFTHVAFGVYSRITTADGRTLPGYAIYNLYQRSDEHDLSDLVMDYPMDYFTSAYELESAIIIPVPELQRRLLGVITSDVYPKLHTPRYSVISNPFDPGFQNCTEFVLNVLNAAIYETGDIEQIKANIRAYFAPQPIEISPMKLMLGSLFKRDVVISDHDGPVRTATLITIARYMQKHGLAEEVFTVRASAAPPPMQNPQTRTKAPPANLHLQTAATR